MGCGLEQGDSAAARKNQGLFAALASSLVMPTHTLDDFDEEYLPGQEGRGE